MQLCYLDDVRNPDGGQGVESRISYFTLNNMGKIPLS